MTATKARVRQVAPTGTTLRKWAGLVLRPPAIGREYGGVTYGPTHLATELVADWRAQAACSGYANSLFFPASEEADEVAIERAKAICSVCPVAGDCLEYALETNQRAGIWGGTSEKERKSLRRKWLAERRRTA